MKLKKRLRKCCPKCNKLNIYRAKSTKKYKCWSCKTVFETPGARVVQHREVARRRYNYTYHRVRNNEEKSVIPLHRKLLPFPDG